VHGELRKSEIGVKVLRLPNKRLPDGTLGKQDADDYIKNCGPAAFEELMEDSANSAEYRLSVVQGRFDLGRDDQRAQYLLEAAEVVAGLPSPVEREIYAGRCAETAGVSKEAVLQEVERQRQKRRWEARKQEERRNLAPVRELQPRNRELRYENLRSARAEEGVLRIILLDGDYFRQMGPVDENCFTSPLLKKAFVLLRERWRAGKSVSLPALEGQLTPEEMDQLSAAVQENQPPNTAAAALEDYKQVILLEQGRRDIEDAQDLGALKDVLKQKKAYGG